MYSENYSNNSNFQMINDELLAHLNEYLLDGQMVHVDLCVYMCVYICVCECVCVCMGVCECVCAWVCVCQCVLAHVCFVTTFSTRRSTKHSGLR